MRGILLLTALLVFVLAGMACTADEFFISYWWAPEELTQEKFQEIADCGFNVAWFQQFDNQQKRLDLCQAVGLKAIIRDERLIAKKSSDKDFESNLDSVIADYANHPALWGYHITDEPNAGLFGWLGDINKYLLKKDPKHVPFINLFPTYARDFPGALGTATYDEHVAAYMKTVQPKILSYDHYALKQGWERPDYFENLETIRKYSLKHNVPFNDIFQVTPHFDYRDTSEVDLRWQVNTGLAYGAKGLMYFCYTWPDPTNGVFGPSLLDKKGRKTIKYYYARDINAEVRKLAPTLMQLTSTGVYHTLPLPSSTNPLPKGTIVKGIDGGEFVIGLFKAKNGDKYAMFVNRSFKKKANARIEFSQRVKLQEVSRSTGQLDSVAVHDNGFSSVWTGAFKPGEGRLVRIEPQSRAF